MSFGEYLARQPVERWLETARHASAADVERALRAEHPDMDDFAALLSPAAEDRL